MLLSMLIRYTFWLYVCILYRQLVLLYKAPSLFLYWHPFWWFFWILMDWLNVIVHLTIQSYCHFGCSTRYFTSFGFVCVFYLLAEGVGLRNFHDWHLCYNTGIRRGTRVSLKQYIKKAKEKNSMEKTFRVNFQGG